MTNEQLTAARAVINRFETMKITVGQVDGADTLTPYMIEDVFQRGTTVEVRKGTTPETLTTELRRSCEALARAEG